MKYPQGMTKMIEKELPTGESPLSGIYKRDAEY